MNWDFEPEMRDYEGELRRLRTSRGYLVLIVVSGIALAAAVLSVIGLV